MAKKKRAMDMPELVGIISAVYSDVADYAERMNKLWGSGTYIKVMGKAFEKITEPMYQDMKDFVSKGNHYRSGNTLGSLHRGEMIAEDSTYLKFKLGFDMRNGGFPALILEYGDNGSPMRMPNTAYFFVYWAVKNHSYENWKDEDMDVFHPIFEELAEEAKKIGQ